MLSIHTILHPTDLSEESAAAFRLANALARDYTARLVLLTAYPPLLNWAEAVDRTRSDGVEEVLLAKLQALNPDPSVPVEYLVEEGKPADMILVVAEETHADLIVMGTHGRGGLSRALMGSVAEAVNRAAACPVVTVRGQLRIDTGQAHDDYTPGGDPCPSHGTF